MFFELDARADSGVERLEEIFFYPVIIVIAQTFVYGMYCCLMPLFIFSMAAKGLKTSIRRSLFGLVISMFIISTTCWIFSAVELLQSIQLLVKGDYDSESVPVEVTKLLNAIMFINYFLADAVVVWRSWVLCSNEYRRALKVAVFLLMIVALTVVSTIVIRIILELPVNRHQINDASSTLNKAIDISQMMNLTISLMTNLFATSIVAIKAWKYRQSIRRDFRSWNNAQTKGRRILLMLVDSGSLYCCSGFLIVLFSCIRIGSATLGDIYNAMNFQIAGMYPIVVFLLVNKDGSMHQNVFLCNEDTTCTSESTPSFYIEGTLDPM